ncbi:MAG TPA: hypothetical protein VD886_14030 [Herpetosiphonaceae bacterium]|nr:hypothetical protein [Herpetosiphonaceae bacterium]
MPNRPPTSREGLIYGIGSGVFSALLAGAAGTIYGLPTVTLLAMVILAALGGGYFGYRSRMRQE